MWVSRKNDRENRINWVDYFHIGRRCYLNESTHMCFDTKDTSAAKCGQLLTGAKKLLTTFSFWTLFSQLHTCRQVNIISMEDDLGKRVKVHSHYIYTVTHVNTRTLNVETINCKMKIVQNDKLGRTLLKLEASKIL